MSMLKPAPAPLLSSACVCSYTCVLSCAMSCARGVRYLLCCTSSALRHAHNTSADSAQHVYCDLHHVSPVKTCRSLRTHDVRSFVQDADYEASGAKIGKVGDAFGSDIVLKVRLQMSRFQDCFNTLQTPAHAALW